MPTHQKTEKSMKYELRVILTFSKELKKVQNSQVIGFSGMWGDQGGRCHQAVTTGCHNSKAIQSFLRIARG